MTPTTASFYSPARTAIKPSSNHGRGHTHVVPGGVLMSLAAAAAYKTIGRDFALDMLHAQFLAGPRAEFPLQLCVQRLNNGGRFATRIVTVEQGGSPMVHATCSFVRASALGGPSMQHAVHRATSQTVEAITLDDLAPGRKRQGPYMQFQRLPLAHRSGTMPPAPVPDSLIYTSVASISPIRSDDPQLQILGVVALSDYHILDATPTLHGLTFGLPHIDDTTRTPTYSHMERFTTLNHTIHFYRHHGFRADDLCYIEVTSPWSGTRRAEVHSNIFDRQGALIATCVQGSYYVLKEPAGKL